MDTISEKQFWWILVTIPSPIRLLKVSKPCILTVKYSVISLNVLIFRLPSNELAETNFYEKNTCCGYLLQSPR